MREGGSSASDCTIMRLIPRTGSEAQPTDRRSAWHGRQNVCNKNRSSYLSQEEGRTPSFFARVSRASWTSEMATCVAPQALAAYGTREAQAQAQAQAQVRDGQTMRCCMKRGKADLTLKRRQCVKSVRAVAQGVDMLRARHHGDEPHWPGPSDEHPAADRDPPAFHLQGIRREGELTSAGVFGISGLEGPQQTCLLTRQRLILDLVPFGRTGAREAGAGRHERRPHRSKRDVQRLQQRCLLQRNVILRGAATRRRRADFRVALLMVLCSQT